MKRALLLSSCLAAACAVPDLELVTALPGQGGSSGSSAGGSSAGTSDAKSGSEAGGTTPQGGGGSGAGGGSAGMDPLSNAGAGGEAEMFPPGFDLCSVKPPGIFCDSFEDGTTKKWKASSATVDRASGADPKAPSHILHSKMQVLQPASDFAHAAGDAKLSAWVRTANTAQQDLIGFKTITGAVISISVAYAHYQFKLSKEPPVYAPSSPAGGPLAVANQWICVELTHNANGVSGKIVLPDGTQQAMPIIDSVGSYGEDDKWNDATGNTYNWGDGLWQIGDANADIDFDDIRLSLPTDDSGCDVGFMP